MSDKADTLRTENPGPADEFRTVEYPGDLDPVAELSEYLDALSNGTRLKILKCLDKKARTTREIAKETGNSYENTKKHLERLCQIGVVRKDAGITDPRMKGIQLYWKYSIVPGGLESVIRNLGLFSHMKMHIVRDDISGKIDDARRMVSCEVLGNDPVIIVLGGQDDGMTFTLRRDIIRIGRFDHAGKGKVSPVDNLVLSHRYLSVSRVTRPHARLYRDKNSWYIEDNGSSGGTSVNKKTLDRGRRVPLRDGDLIELSKGPNSARLLFIIPAGT